VKLLLDEHFSQLVARRLRDEHSDDVVAVTIIGETVRQLPAKVHAQVAGVDWGAAIGLQEWLDQG